MIITIIFCTQGASDVVGHRWPRGVWRSHQVLLSWGASRKKKIIIMIMIILTKSYYRGAQVGNTISWPYFHDIDEYAAHQVLLSWSPSRETGIMAMIWWQCCPPSFIIWAVLMMTITMIFVFISFFAFVFVFVFSGLCFCFLHDRPQFSTGSSQMAKKGKKTTLLKVPCSPDHKNYTKDDMYALLVL